MPYRHPRTTPVATAVQIRRAEEGSPGGFTVGGGAGTIEWVGGGSRRPPTQESSEREWVGGGGAETPLLVSCTKYPSWRICMAKGFKFPPMLKHLPLTSINP